VCAGARVRARELPAPLRAVRNAGGPPAASPAPPPAPHCVPLRARAPSVLCFEQPAWMAHHWTQVVAMGLQAGKVVGAVAKVCGGGGGGKPQVAQAGGKDASKVGEALELARKLLMEGL